MCVCVYVLSASLASSVFESLAAADERRSAIQVCLLSLASPLRGLTVLLPPRTDRCYAFGKTVTHLSGGVKASAK